MLKKKFSLLLLPLAATFSLQAANPFNDPFFNDPFGDDIFKEMLQMQRDMDKMFERMQQRMNQRSSGLVSPLGTYKMAVQNQLVDKGDHYDLVTNIPESKENHIDIKTANGMMSITAKIVQENEEKSQYGISQSRSVRMYQQSTSLPADADESTIKTSYKDGKLVVTIAKKKGAVKTVTTQTPQKTEVKKSVEKVVVPKANYEKKAKLEVKKEKKDTSEKENNTTGKPVSINSDVPSMS
jgi:HSP20 family protein